MKPSSHTAETPGTTDRQTNQPADPPVPPRAPDGGPWYQAPLQHLDALVRAGALQPAAPVTVYVEHNDEGATDRIHEPDCVWLSHHGCRLVAAPRTAAELVSLLADEALTPCDCLATPYPLVNDDDPDEVVPLLDGLCPIRLSADDLDGVEWLTRAHHQLDRDDAAAADLSAAEEVAAARILLAVGADVARGQAPGPIGDAVAAILDTLRTIEIAGLADPSYQAERALAFARGAYAWHAYRLTHADGSETTGTPSKLAAHTGDLDPGGNRYVAKGTAPNGVPAADLLAGITQTRVWVWVWEHGVATFSPLRWAETSEVVFDDRQRLLALVPAAPLWDGDRALNDDVACVDAGYTADLVRTAWTLDPGNVEAVATALAAARS